MIGDIHIKTCCKKGLVKDVSKTLYPCNFFN